VSKWKTHASDKEQNSTPSRYCPFRPVPVSIVAVFPASRNRRQVASSVAAFAAWWIGASLHSGRNRWLPVTTTPHTAFLCYQFSLLSPCALLSLPLLPVSSPNRHSNAATMSLNRSRRRGNFAIQENPLGLESHNENTRMDRHIAACWHRLQRTSRPT